MAIDAIIVVAFHSRPTSFWHKAASQGSSSGNIFSNSVPVPQQMLRYFTGGWGSPKSQWFILWTPWIFASNSMAIPLTVVCFSSKNHKGPHGSGTRKARGPTTSGGLILWRPWLHVQDFMVIHPTLLKYFTLVDQSGGPTEFPRVTLLTRLNFCFSNP